MCLSNSIAARLPSEVLGQVCQILLEDSDYVVSKDIKIKVPHLLTAAYCVCKHWVSARVTLYISTSSPMTRDRWADLHVFNVQRDIISRELYKTIHIRKTSTLRVLAGLLIETPALEASFKSLIIDFGHKLIIPTLSSRKASAEKSKRTKNSREVWKLLNMFICVLFIRVLYIPSLTSDDLSIHYLNMYALESSQLSCLN